MGFEEFHVSPVWFQCYETKYTQTSTLTPTPTPALPGGALTGEIRANIIFYTLSHMLALRLH